jgi:type VI protein secretion system component VasF
LYWLISRNKLEILADDIAYHQTARKRKTLLDLFSNLDNLAKRVKNLPASANESKLHGNITRDTAEFVQRNMQTLQIMPRVTRDDDDIEIQVILKLIHRLLIWMM